MKKRFVRKKIEIEKLVRLARASLDMTQKEFAERLGVNVMTVSSWENGKNVPATDSFREILRILNHLEEEMEDGNFGI